MKERKKERKSNCIHTKLFECTHVQSNLTFLDTCLMQAPLLLRTVFLVSNYSSSIKFINMSHLNLYTFCPGVTSYYYHSQPCSLRVLILRGFNFQMPPAVPKKCIMNYVVLTLFVKSFLTLAWIKNKI